MPAIPLDLCDGLEAFVRRLAAFGAPVEAGWAAARHVTAAPVVHARRGHLHEQPDGGPEIILTGWVSVTRIGQGRSNQVLGFMLPGDFLGSFWRKMEFDFCRMTALTRASTLCARSLLLLNAHGLPAHPEVLRAARRAEDHTRHLLMDHVVRLSARDAYAGLSHLLLELHARLDRIGQVREQEFHMPIGQRMLAQAMGFSVAHTNYTLQRMVSDGLVAFRGQTVRLLEPDRMARLADFTPVHPEASDGAPIHS